MSQVKGIKLAFYTIDDLDGKTSHATLPRDRKVKNAEPMKAFASLWNDKRVCLALFPIEKASFMSRAAIRDGRSGSSSVYKVRLITLLKEPITRE